jgi:Carboxypeptidase regulatory-like domain
VKSIVFIVAACPLVWGPAFGQIQQVGANGQPAAMRISNQPPPPTSFDCAIDGSVVNSQTGEPIARAHVTLNSSGPTPSTSTDSSGKWSISNLPCAPAGVMVTRPGFLQQVRRVANLVSGSPVHDMKIELTPQSVFYGKVTDDQGDAVMGAEVAVFVARIAEGRLSFQRNFGSNTNDLGEYRVPNITRGKYIVCSSARNALQRDDLVGVQTCYPGPIEGGTASAMDVPAGREIKVDFTLREAPAVHVRGTVTGLPEGRNSGVNIVPRGAATTIVNGVNMNGRDGKFDFRVPPGSYMITADYFEAGKHLLARAPIDVGSTDIDNVTVAMDSGFNITGQVRINSQSQQTSARPQFGMNLRPVEPTTGAGQLKWDADHTSFAFNDMSPGAYRFDVFPPSPFYVKSATLAGQDILNNEFSVAQAAGPIEIVLSDDGGSIEGDVVNADGQPVTGGIIALRNGRATVIQSVGHFKLLNLAPGDYTVYAWDDANQVEYADQEWMRRYGGSGTAVTVSTGQNAQVKLTQQKVPQ